MPKVVIEIEIPVPDMNGDRVIDQQDISTVFSPIDQATPIFKVVRMANAYFLNVGLSMMIPDYNGDRLVDITDISTIVSLADQATATYRTEI